ncbi:Integral membrane protein OS=Streptomyces fumanus OX=67302 GN=GCM10018772_44390 PE=4 SV=1 [Streptomyces fumanus]
MYDGYLHPSFAEGPATGEPATGPTVDPYDRSRPLTGDEREECGEVTRT